MILTIIFLSLSLLSTGKYICVTGRTQQSLMTRTPSSAKGSSLCSRLLSDGKKRMRFVCVCATKISKHHPSSTHPTLFPSFYSSYSLLSSKLGNTTINCNSPLTLGVHKTNWKKSSIDVIKKIKAELRTYCNRFFFVFLKQLKKRKKLCDEIFFA
jgi:hypothetical protein